MFTQDFYKVIDNELSELLEKYKDDRFIKKHRNSPNNQKSYALLIWFLEFYGRTSDYASFITDGNDDSSCDIVFDNVNNQGERIFYVVQSKWNNARNAEKETEKDEILKALNDFETLLRGEKKNLNETLKKKLYELDSHLKANKEVKFIFLNLSQYKGSADENINAFRKNDKKTKFEVIDIDRIKVNYIDRKYKKIEPLNPLESYADPEENIVPLEIVQNNGRIEIQKPFEAYMLLLRPKSIHELFEKYGFYLFHKNVRNPLLQSKFNEDIEKTALDNPAYFWYYNNGVTAITYILPEIGKQAERIELTGLQIINGAQTIYSIYRAYEKASVALRSRMNNEALVTLRLLKSGGKKFDLDVTRYTNSQNPVYDRDFCANDEIQVKLQNASYKTNIWYEKRRGEFRDYPEGIITIPNSVFANVYLAYSLQDPASVLNNYSYGKLNQNKDLNFTSHREHKDGLYEKIFNETTKFEDMLCALYVFRIITNMFDVNYSKSFDTSCYHILSLFKITFTKYFQAKYDEKINVEKKIIELYENKDYLLLAKAVRFITGFVLRICEIEDNENRNLKKFGKFLFKSLYYEKVKEELEESIISVDDIERIILEDEDKSIDNEKSLELGEEEDEELE